ncbi:MAG: hypothetical protein N3A61_04225 [Ignavibacteria bacterium]|nr:hypothetical protein [Ignavibacteria bacterium]
MKSRFSLLIILIVSSLLFAGSFIEYFKGKSENEKVTLEWKTREESNLKEFVIERKSTVGDFISIGSIPPKGSNSYYTFIDENAFKSSSAIYVYRLKIVDLDGSTSYSNSITVSHSVSGVKRTWGSIKAMFR